MKIKCVSNIGVFGTVSDYLTVGNVYDMTTRDNENAAGEIMDDTGEIIYTRVTGKSHGKFEVVEE